MTRFIIVRHGQSEGNAKGEFHGQYNSDLTELGHEQAECTAEYVDRYTIDVIYSSDIRRAYSTAKHTADRRGLPITADTGLREIFAGEWERMSFDEIPKKYPEEYRVWHEDIAHSHLPGGESVAEMAERVNAAFEKIAAENDGKTVFVATHATPIRAMRCKWLGVPLTEMQRLEWVPNASVTVVEYDGNKRNVLFYGQAEHLIKAGLLTGLPKKI